MRKQADLRSALILLVLLCLLAGSFPASASNALQAAFGLRINAVEVVEDTDALLLNTYFTIFDNVSGDVVTNARIASAEVAFVDTQVKSEASLLQPDTPFYIALVLDSSGSMSGAATALRSAAVEAIKSPPVGARFAIMTFNEEFEVLQEFLDIRNTDPLERAIAKVQPVNGKGTCLYDAAFSAIAELERAPQGRRAVILFTDGRDELSNGDPCSKHSYEDVIQYATRNDINTPIHTIAMAGRENAVNSEELKNMAVTTGGFSVVGTQENLSELFDGIMEVLKSQWLAQARLYPEAGTHNVLLRLRLDDGSIISETLTFNSSRSYTAPLAPLGIGLAGLGYNSAKSGYQVDLNIVSPERLQSLAVAVWDKKSGLKVQETVYNDFSPSTSFLLPADLLTIGGEYELRFNAFGSDNQAIPNAENETPFLIHEFRHDISTEIQVDTVTINGTEMTARLLVRNQQEIGEYQTWLMNEETNVQVPGSEYTATQLTTDSALLIPLENVPEGEYKLVVRVLDRAGKPASSFEYEGINYTPPPAPGFFKVIIGALVKNPLILITILLILFAIIGWLVFSSMRSRSMTATPILQSSLPSVSMKGAHPLPISETLIGVKNDPSSATTLVANRQATLVLPTAVLRILESTDPDWVGKTCTLTRFPFTIGREDCDLNIGNDRSISHKHATITYDERLTDFLITDASRNGVLLGGQRIPKDTPVRLTPGTVLGLGPRTTAIFELQ